MNRAQVDAGRRYNNDKKVGITFDPAHQIDECNPRSKTSLELKSQRTVGYFGAGEYRPPN